ncbi:LIC_11485 family protein [Leptospira idonii]|uniref:LIC_11485 family protein n=1 Tax=Leptospira idonii TaxID=1193500 RepID=UPI001FE6D0F7|nr:hypothetical protein [Leptospira idonii]
MVDLKKINIPKVNVDTKKVMGAVDGLVDKIPPQVQSLLRKIAFGLLIFFLVMGIYTGWSKGWDNATPQGLQLAQDTRSLFLTEIEREYNRKRKDVQMTDPENLTYENNRRMQFDFISEREKTNPNQNTLPEESDFLGKEYDFRNRRSMDTETPPMATPSGDGLISSPIDVEKMGNWENKDSGLLNADAPASGKELERSNVDLSAKPAKTNLRNAPLENSETEEDIRFKKMLDRVDQLEKRVAEKRKKEAASSAPAESVTEPKRKLRELDRVPR